jgi:predicted lipoprotein
MDPAFQDVTDPQARLRAEVLQQAVRGLRGAVETEIGARLGIAPGFNSQDGD